jgi:NADH dehydrogenase FAD-containing subunit
MIAVKKTLQIADSKYPNVYALGDVAETGGVRMGRAASQQADVVSYNITRAIRGKSLREYKPIPFMEAGIDLTLGLVSLVYSRRLVVDEEIWLTRF